MLRFSREEREWHDVFFLIDLHSRDRNYGGVRPGVLARIKKEKLIGKAERDLGALACFTGDDDRSSLGLHDFLADG